MPIVGPNHKKRKLSGPAQGAAPESEKPDHHTITGETEIG